MAESIIGECRERFVPMEFSGSAPLKESGVISAGLSRVPRSHQIVCAMPPFHSVIYSENNSGTLRFEGRTVTLERDALWILPAHVDYTLTARSEVWGLMWFHVQSGARWAHLNGLSPYQRFAGQSERMVWIMDGLISESTAPQYDRVKMGRLFAEILCVFLDRRLRKSQGKFAHLREHLAAVWSKVDSDLSHQWTRKALAAEFGVSVPHFHRLVRQFCKSSPAKMVTQMRMIRVKDLLANTDHKLGTIARMVGYKDAFSLSRSFRQCIGKSPRNYRLGRRHEQEGAPPRDGEK